MILIAKTHNITPISPLLGTSDTGFFLLYQTNNRYLHSGSNHFLSSHNTNPNGLNDGLGVGAGVGTGVCTNPNALNDGLGVIVVDYLSSIFMTVYDATSIAATAYLIRSTMIIMRKPQISQTKKPNRIAWMNR